MSILKFHVLPFVCDLLLKCRTHFVIQLQFFETSSCQEKSWLVLRDTSQSFLVGKQRSIRSINLIFPINFFIGIFPYLVTYYIVYLHICFQMFRDFVSYQHMFDQHIIIRYRPINSWAIVKNLPVSKQLPIPQCHLRFGTDMHPILMNEAYVETYGPECTSYYVP